MRSKLVKLLYIGFVLFAVSAANAAPTISNGDVLYCSVSPSSNLDIEAVPELAELTEYSDSHLARVAAEFVKPPSVSSALAGSPAIRTKTLPAVPAAFLMVLTGFLCISLVRDRKVWLAALAGLLWAGQTGIEALPQLAQLLRLSHANHSKQQLCAEPTCTYYLENSHRLRSDIEGTQYIGLLRHLAGIPDNKSAPANRHLNTLITFSQRQKLHRKAFTYLRKNTYISQSAILLEQYSFNLLFKCLALRAEQFICFSPAFIFENLPRGPPNLA